MGPGSPTLTRARPAGHTPKAQTSGAPPAGWLQNPRHDLAMALIWVPFAAVAHAAAHNSTQLQWVVAATLVFSFAHQPLTLWLTYGDATQRQAHRVLFAWAPAAAIIVIQKFAGSLKK